MFMQHGATRMAEILFHDEAQLLDYGESRTAGPYIKLRLPDPSALGVFRGMDTATEKRAGHILHVTIAQGDIIAEPAQLEMYGPPESQCARELWRVGFFFNPRVYVALGTDAEFRDWVETQPSVLSGKFNEYRDGAGRCVAHHVLSSEAAPSRDGPNPNKPEYRSVPLTHEEHQFLHQHGPLAALREYKDVEMFADQDSNQARKSSLEWWKKAAADHVSRWAHRRLVEVFGAESLNDVAMCEIVQWAEKHELRRYLPNCFVAP
jgi:hypothetical protein